MLSFLLLVLAIQQNIRDDERAEYPGAARNPEEPDCSRATGRQWFGAGQLQRAEVEGSVVGGDAHQID